MSEKRTNCPQEFGENGRYVVQSLLGEGGMAQVFRARDNVLERDVAIKVIRPEIVNASQCLKRFEREGKVIGALTHPGLVSIFDLEISDEYPYIVMEYVSGEDLYSYHKAGKSLPIQDVRRIIRQLSETMAYVHENEIVHRDIKPSNLFLSAEDEWCKLGDFGLTRDLDETRLTKDSGLLGTPDYLPPEVFRGEDHECPGDIFQLGLLFHYLFCAKLPYATATAKRMLLCDDEKAWKLDGLKDTLPRDLRIIISACCQFQSDKRPADGKELLALVSKELIVEKAKTSVEKKVAPKAPSKAPPKSKRPYLGYVFWLCLILLCWHIYPKPQRPIAPVKISCLAWFPDGFYLKMAKNGYKSPSWKISINTNIFTGSFKKVKDGLLAHPKDLPLTGRGVLSLYEGSKLLHEKSFQRVTNSLAATPDVVSGLNWLQLSWRLHGNAPITVTVSSADKGKVRKSPTLKNRALFDFGTIKRKMKVNYYLHLGERELTRGQVNVGPEVDEGFTRLVAYTKGDEVSAGPVLTDNYVVIGTRLGNIRAIPRKRQSKYKPWTKSYATYTLKTTSIDDLLPFGGDAVVVVRRGWPVTSELLSPKHGNVRRETLYQWRNAVVRTCALVKVREHAVAISAAEPLQPGDPRRCKLIAVTNTKTKEKVTIAANAKIEVCGSKSFGHCGLTCVTAGDKTQLYCFDVVSGLPIVLWQEELSLSEQNRFARFTAIETKVANRALFTMGEVCGLIHLKKETNCVQLAKRKDLPPHITFLSPALDLQGQNFVVYAEAPPRNQLEFNVGLAKVDLIDNELTVWPVGKPMTKVIQQYISAYRFTKGGLGKGIHSLNILNHLLIIDLQRQSLVYETLSDTVFKGIALAENQRFYALMENGHLFTASLRPRGVSTF